MRSYGQFCPVAKAAELFCERWTALILRDLAGGSSRFSELQRGVPLASPTLLSRRLKQLEAARAAAGPITSPRRDASSPRSSKRSAAGACAGAGASSPGTKSISAS
jgi:hypothetical protein